MTNVTSSKSLIEKITVYDAFNMLKSNLSEDNTRHTLEGAVIIASPSVVHSTHNNKGLGDAHDSRYKLELAKTMINMLSQYSKEASNETFDADKQIAKLLASPVVWNYPGYGKKGMNLPFVVTQIYNNLDDKRLMVLSRRLGEVTEKGLRPFYTDRGYNINKINRPKDVASYLIAECEYLTRMTAEMSNRSRKIF